MIDVELDLRNQRVGPVELSLGPQEVRELHTCRFTVQIHRCIDEVRFEQ
jgi:hypothetical protein